MYHIKQDKRSEQTSQLIVTALAQCMNEKDFDAISIVELVAKANVARATFYRHFDEIDDVLRLECDQAFEALRSEFIAHYKSAEDSTGKTVFVLPFLRFWDTRTAVIERLIQANRVDFINNGIASMIQFFLSARLHAEDPAWHRLDYFVAKRSGEVLNVLVQWVKNRKDIPADELANLITVQSEKSLNLTLGI